MKSWLLDELSPESLLYVQQARGWILFLHDEEQSSWLIQATAIGHRKTGLWENLRNLKLSRAQQSRPLQKFFGEHTEESRPVHYY
jgi:hypothetical protein